MKKLTLNLDSLAVESFEAAQQPAGRGTVVGAEAVLTGPANCVTVSCGNSEVQPCELY
jgi:hypothetical protein